METTLVMNYYGPSPGGLRQRAIDEKEKDLRAVDDAAFLVKNTRYEKALSQAIYGHRANEDGTIECHARARSFTEERLMGAYDVDKDPRMQKAVDYAKEHVRAYLDRHFWEVIELYVRLQVRHDPTDEGAIGMLCITATLRAQERRERIWRAIDTAVLVLWSLGPVLFTLLLLIIVTINSGAVKRT